MAMLGGYNYIPQGHGNSHQRTSPDHGKQRRDPVEDQNSVRLVTDCFSKSPVNHHASPKRQESVPEWLKAQVRRFRSSLPSCVESEKYQGYDVQSVLSRGAREKMLINSRNSFSLAFDRELSDRGDLITSAFTFPIIGRYSQSNSVNIFELGAVDGISANILIEQLRMNAGIESTVYLINNHGRIASLNYSGVERIESSPLELDIESIHARYERLRSKNIDAVVMKFSLANYDADQQLELLKTARVLLPKGGLLLIMDEGPEFGSDYDDFMHKILYSDSLRHYASLAEVIEMAGEAEFALNGQGYGGKQNPLSLTRSANSLLYCSSIEEKLCMSNAQKEELRSLFKDALESDRLKIFQTRINFLQETVVRGVIQQELVSSDDFYIPREIYAVAFRAV